MKRGEIYRSVEKPPERGYKPGFYLVVSRDFVCANEDISTVVCAPIYSEILGLRSEVLVGTEERLPRLSAVRCDFLMLLFKKKLTQFVSSLSKDKIQALNRAIRYALQLED
ncbi:MAG: type II toxin-antitoxin system PemK/MazF family toxin [Candidatus Eremiobacteraeota bacterium]|nr:type II toxin-antitoxin system PemK/MazF family toxin [Candidatus Eremiobacteraeota bacterium]